MNDLCGLEYELTTDPQAFGNYDGPKFSYSKNPVEDELFFNAAGLLYERKIEGQELSFIDFAGSKAFFTTFHRRSALPFDPFAAAFYLVSRYEEYLPYVKDEFDRFNAKISIAYQKGFLHKPVVNLWACELQALLKTHYPNLRISRKQYSFIPTIDIDASWLFKGKGFLRSAGGYFKSFSRFDLKEINKRTSVLLRLTSDPLDTYDEQLEMLRRYKLRAIYFILFADYGLNDKNIPVNNPYFQVLIKSIADFSDIGIHSSFASSYNGDKLRIELERLSAVLNKDIVKNRQHYLRLNFPFNYRQLIDLDIIEDYSMGYNSFLGFRAGITDPFPFFDLDLDAVTRLKIYPFAFSINKFHRINSHDKLQRIGDIIEEVRKVNGTLVGLWDNEALSDFKDKGWKDKFEAILKIAVD